MTTAEYAALRTEQAADCWAIRTGRRSGAARWCLYASPWSPTPSPTGIPVQRELVIAWTCGALACASIGRPPRQIVQLVLDWLPIVVILSVYDFTRGQRRLARDRRPRPPDDRLRPLRLLRPDADRMAPGAPLRPRRRALVRRRLHPRLHLLLHRPVRHSPASSGRATGSPSCASPSASSPSPSPGSRPTSPSPPRRPGWPAKWGCSTASTGPPRTAGRCSTSTPPRSSPTARTPSTRSPRCPRCTPAFTALVAMFLWPRVRPRWRPLLAGLPAGDGPDADGDRRALLLRRGARLVLRRRGDGRLGLVGTAQAARLRAEPAPT